MNSTDHEVHDPRFRLLVQPNAPLQKLAGDCLWAEGPAYFPASDMLVWSDIPNNRMLRWAPGMGEHDGSIVVLASHYQGGRLNSPNDLVVDSKGAIWFTDPDYGILSDYEGFRAPGEIGGCHVYAMSPDSREPRRVADDFVKPNGLAFSPDESRLYVADSGATHVDRGPRHIRVFDVGREGRLSRSRIFVEMASGIPDGLRVDEHGNVWTSAEDGVHCYAPDGTLLGKILLPETAANLTFGGLNRNRLFITASASLYSLHVGVRGAAR
jgi:gluconolactonase